MAKILKKVNRLIPSVLRTQVFTSADAASTDILDLLNSLGRAAKTVRIETTGSSNLSVRANVCHTIYPDRTDGVFEGHQVNLALGQEIVDTTVAAEVIGPDSQNLTGPIQDLEVTWTTGSWTIAVS